MKKEKESEIKKSEPVIQTVQPHIESIPEPVMSFERWFRIRGKERAYKSHWIEGMKAFTDTTVSRPMAEWDQIFKAY